jgi:hypothetical protein
MGMEIEQHSNEMIKKNPYNCKQLGDSTPSRGPCLVVVIGKRAELALLRQHWNHCSIGTIKP